MVDYYFDANRELEELLQANWAQIDFNLVQNMGDYNDALKTGILENSDVAFWQSKVDFTSTSASLTPTEMYLHEHRSSVVSQKPDVSLEEYHYQISIGKVDITFGFFNLSLDDVELVVWVGGSSAHHVVVPAQHFTPFFEGRYPYLDFTGWISSRRVYSKTKPDNLIIVNGLFDGKIRRRFVSDFKMWNTQKNLSGTLFVADQATYLHYRAAEVPPIEQHLALPDLFQIHQKQKEMKRKKAAAHKIIRIWIDRSSNPEYKYCQEYQRRKFNELRHS